MGNEAQNPLEDSNPMVWKIRTRGTQIQFYVGSKRISVNSKII